MPRKKTKSRKLVTSAMREVHKNPPKRVAKTLKNKGKAAAEKQLRGIALDKARKAGARVPKKR